MTDFDDIDIDENESEDLDNDLRYENARQLVEYIENVVGNKGIEKVKELDLKGYVLAYITEDIRKLKYLEKLDLSFTGAYNFPNEIGLLTKLKFLSLEGNSLYFLPKTIGNLKQLQYLSLRGGGLDEIPFNLGNLINLEELDLSNNRLKSLPEDIGKLTKLRKLYLDRNLLTNLPPEIGSLKKLTHLSASNSQKFGAVVQLSIPGLGIDNEISELPMEIKELKELEYLDLLGNPLAIPPEIIGKADSPETILNYYFTRLLEKTRSLNEAKILLVGESTVGKTSLVNRITEDTYNPNQNKTDGISIKHWSTTNIKQEEIKLNVWDFGGQEIMHATHQFFMTHRALYLLVLDSRISQDQNKIEYWLKIIQSFGGESPVLIVGNKIDQHPLDIDRTGLQKKYQNIVGIFETSAETGAGIKPLTTEIAKQVANLPHIRDQLPETWFTVKSKLEELGKDKNFITQDEYLSLCGANDVTDETSQHTLIGFLHDLGVVLHFQDDRRLAELGILNPQWVTNGVYKILNYKPLFDNKGVLTLSMLDDVLSDNIYPKSKRLFIVDMMKKFELCYDIEPDKEFLIPDLLPKDEPDKIEIKSVAAFQYQYPVLPSSVVTRFVVRMNKYIENNIAWRTGVVLKIGNNRAIVKADIEDKKISIYIDGVEHTRRDALTAIRYQLDEIHDTIKGLNPQKRVPIPEAPNAEPLEYDYLLQLERDGFEEHPVKDGNRLVKINVRKLLSGIESETKRKETGGNVTNIYVGGNFDGNLTIGDGNQSIKDSYNKIAAAKIDPELMQTLKQLAEAVSTMTKDLPKEQATEVTEDFSKLVDEAIKAKPNKRWYSVSIDGLTKAAENLDKLGEPVINLSKKVFSLLTGGVIS